jgi:hypothetical protein
MQVAGLRFDFFRLLGGASENRQSRGKGQDSERITAAAHAKSILLSEHALVFTIPGYPSDDRTRHVGSTHLSENTRNANTIRQDGNLRFLTEAMSAAAVFPFAQRS